MYVDCLRLGTYTAMIVQAEHVVKAMVERLYALQTSPYLPFLQDTSAGPLTLIDVNEPLVCCIQAHLYRLYEQQVSLQAIIQSPEDYNRSTDQTQKQQPNIGAGFCHVFCAK